MADLLTNFAYAALTADVTAAATSIPVDETSRLPTNAQMAASDFYMTFDSTAALGAYEVVKVTAKSTTSGAGNLTVVRAQDGSTAAVHPSGTAIRGALTAGHLTRLVAPLTPSAARAWLTADYTLPNAVATALSLTSENFDTANLHDTVTNPSRITIVTPGKYLVSGTIAYATSNGGQIQTRIHKNGTLVALTTANTATNLQCTDVLDLVAGDYIELFGYIATGTSVLYSGIASTFLTVALINGGTVGSSIVPMMARPQGVLQRRYTFDTDIQSWTSSGSGVLSQANGQLVTTVPVSTEGRYYEPTTATPVADGEIYADIYPVTNDTNYGTDAAILFRVQDVNNWYGFSIHTAAASSATPEMSLLKNVAGTLTAVVGSANSQFFPYLGSLAGPLRLMVRFVGSQISCYINETLVLTAKDTTFSAAGRTGFRFYGNSVNVDNVSVYSLPSSWTPANYDPTPSSTGASKVVTKKVGYSNPTVGTNLSLTSTSLVAVDGTNLDLSVPAQVGDILAFTSAHRVNSSGSGDAVFDAATINSGGTFQNYFGTGTNGNGVGAWIALSGVDSARGATATYTVVASDIVNGMVTVRLVYRISPSGTRTLARDYDQQVVTLQNLSR